MFHKRIDRGYSTTNECWYPFIGWAINSSLNHSKVQQRAHDQQWAPMQSSLYGNESIFLDPFFIRTWFNSDIVECVFCSTALIKWNRAVADRVRVRIRGRASSHRPSVATNRSSAPTDHVLEILGNKILADQSSHLECQVPCFQSSHECPDWSTLPDRAVQASLRCCAWLSIGMFWPLTQIQSQIHSSANGCWNPLFLLAKRRPACKENCSKPSPTCTIAPNETTSGSA